MTANQETGRITRGQFIRRAGVGAMALSAATAGLGGVARAQGVPQTVYFPGNYAGHESRVINNVTYDVYTQLQDAINDAGEWGTIIVESGTWNLPPGPGIAQNYTLLKGQTLTGQGFDANGKPVSTLKFVGPYTFPTLITDRVFSIKGCIGVSVVTDTTVAGLCFDSAPVVPTGVSGGYIRSFVAPLFLGDISNAPVSNGTIFTDGLTLPTVSNATIRDNIVTNFPRYGIFLNNCEHSSVLNNQVVPGIYSVTGAPRPSNVCVALCNFPVKASPSYNTISGNSISNAFIYATPITLFELGVPAATGPNNNIISNNTVSGTISGGGIVLLNNSAQNKIINNDLSGLTAQVAQIRLGSGSNNNFLANNALGSITPTAVAGLWIQTIGNHVSNTIFFGNYPGWASGKGFVFLDYLASDPASQSAGNMVMALKEGVVDQYGEPVPQPPFGFDLCGQVRDIGVNNKIPGYEKCDKAPDWLVQQLRNRVPETDDPGDF